jgi:G8 domain
MKIIRSMISVFSCKAAARSSDRAIDTAANIDRAKPKSFRRETIFAPLIIAGLLLLLPYSASAATKISTGTGSWNTAGTWSPSGVPANGDDVTIAATHTVTVNTNTNSLASLTISGTLRVGDNNTNRNVTVTGNFIVNSGGTFNTAGDGGNVLNVAGNLTNNGTFDANIGGATLSVAFNGSANQSISGTGATTDFNAITVNNTGAANSNIIEVTSTNFTAAAGFLTVTDGILKLSGSFAFSNTFTLVTQGSTSGTLGLSTSGHPGRPLRWAAAR